MSATRKDEAFSLKVSVAIQIEAPPAAVWARLTDAAAFTAWNPTVSRLQGPIALGQRLQIEVPSAPGRVFSPRVVAFEPARRMVWQDGFAPIFQGTRTFLLEGPADGPTRFSMEEVFVGLMLPMIKRSLPNLCADFDAFAEALDRAARA